MIDKILVPLDGSTAAEGVLPLVVHLALAEGAEVELITVLTPVAIWDAATSMIKWDAEEAAARRYIDAKSQELSHRGVNAHSNFAVGDAAYTIFKAARDKDVDFIAMTTHGRSGITRWVMGSVADKLLHTAAPLLVVRPGEDREQPLDAASIRRILVPLDGSELSQAALPMAEEMAKVFRASFVLCHVVSTDWVAYSGMETPVVYQDVLDDMKATAKVNLETTADELKGRGFEVACFVGLGSPSSEIERIASEERVGLIVMSTHGRSGPGRLVMGSVADAVVRNTHLPCLLVRPKQVGQPAAGAHEADAAARPG
jgi:nucleotide-binding universal stress UspA family protein